MAKYSKEYLAFLKRGELFHKTVLNQNPRTVGECVAMGAMAGFSEREVQQFLQYMEHMGAMEIDTPPSKGRMH